MSVDEYVTCDDREPTEEPLCPPDSMLSGYDSASASILLDEDSADEEEYHYSASDAMQRCMELRSFFIQNADEEGVKHLDPLMIKLRAYEQQSRRQKKISEFYSSAVGEARSDT
jgi:hypothetical protein